MYRPDVIEFDKTITRVAGTPASVSHISVCTILRCASVSSRFKIAASDSQCCNDYLLHNNFAGRFYYFDKILSNTYKLICEQILVGAFLFHLRKQNNILNGRLSRHDHRQPVNSDS